MPSWREALEAAQPIRTEFVLSFLPSLIFFCHDTFTTPSLVSQLLSYSHQSVDGRKGNSFTVISAAIETSSPPCLHASDSLLCIFFLLQVSQASLLSRPSARAASTSRASLPVSMSVCHLACQSVCPYSCPSLCLFGSYRTATQQKEHYNPHNLLAKCWGSNCHLLS